MSFSEKIDNIIAVFSPLKAAQRVAYRQALEELRGNYDVGDYSRLNANWRASSGSGEFLDRDSRDIVRARARDLERNSDMMNSLISPWVRNIIGSGRKLQVQIENNEELGKQIEKLWNKWCKARNCDVTGTQSFNQILRTAVRRKKIDGGVIFLKCYTSYTILSIGANNGGIECDDFQIKTRKRSDISACCRPKYADSGVEPDPSDSVTPAAIGDAEVNEVQRWLNSHYGFDIYIDGIYGSQTRAALTKAMQTELNTQFGAGLVVDGICGTMTKAAIRNISNGARGNYTKTLQGFLICNGYDTNGFDGIFGNGTESAVRKYQSSHGLVSDGIAGPATFSSLCG